MMILRSALHLLSTRIELRGTGLVAGPGQALVERVEGMLLEEQFRWAVYVARSCLTPTF